MGGYWITLFFIFVWYTVPISYWIRVMRYKDLMNDFHCDTADNMKLDVLKEVVYRYKNNPEEVAIMCAELEKWSLK